MFIERMKRMKEPGNIIAHFDKTVTMLQPRAARSNVHNSTSRISFFFLLPFLLGFCVCVSALILHEKSIYHHAI